jgi:hypothetical protein
LLFYYSRKKDAVNKDLSETKVQATVQEKVQPNDSDTRLMVARMAMIKAEAVYSDNPNDVTWLQSQQAYREWLAIIDERREDRRHAESGNVSQ